MLSVIENCMNYDNSQTFVTNIKCKVGTSYYINNQIIY